MGEDVISRLFDKLDRSNERLARIETILVEREKRCEDEHEKVDKLQGKVDALEKKESGFDGAKGIVAWGITTAIAIYGAWHK